jgi:hypothetical protein
LRLRTPLQDALEAPPASACFSTSEKMFFAMAEGKNGLRAII